MFKLTYTYKVWPGGLEFHGVTPVTEMSQYSWISPTLMQSYVSGHFDLQAEQIHMN